MIQKATCKFPLALLALGLFWVSSPAKAQSTDELILQVPGVTDKNFTEVTLALSSLNGVSYSGYCSNEKCYFLVIDRTINPDNSGVVNKIKSLQLDFDVKEGVSIQKAIDNCTEFKSPDTIEINNTSSPN